MLQIYAPLENSKYHRTLYIFACINANCWNQNESWSCLRVQSLEQEQVCTSDAVCLSASSWLDDADNWADDNALNDNEQNGNNNMMLLRLNDNKPMNQHFADDDELNCDFAQLVVASDPNANRFAKRFVICFCFYE